MLTNRLAFSVMLIYALAVVTNAKEWRGIVPLHSTRSDVEKLLGPPQDDMEGILVSYGLKDVFVDVQYAANPGCKDDWPYSSWNVPKGTVTFIRVAPRTTMSLADLGLNLAKFKKEQGDYDVVGHFYYIDEEDGFSISVHEPNDISKSAVRAFVYGPQSTDTQLRCKPGKFRIAPPTISFRSA
jgi:hypothetical protein